MDNKEIQSVKNSANPTGNAEADIMSAYKLNNGEQLAFSLFVSDGIRLDEKMHAFLPTAIKVKKVFESKPRGVPIVYECPFDARYSGKFTRFDDFAERVFQKSARTIRRWLAEEGLTDKRFANKPKLTSGSWYSVRQTPKGLWGLNYTCPGGSVSKSSGKSYKSQDEAQRAADFLNAPKAPKPPLEQAPIVIETHETAFFAVRRKKGGKWLCSRKGKFFFDADLFSVHQFGNSGTQEPPFEKLQQYLQAAERQVGQRKSIVTVNLDDYKWARVCGRFNVYPIEAYTTKQANVCVPTPVDVVAGPKLPSVRSK